MITNFTTRLIALPSVLFVLGLVSCEKASKVVAKLGKPAAETEATASSPAAPAAKAAYSRDQVADITPSSYPSFIAKKNALVIVDFHAEWCPPCKMLAPILAEAAEQNPGVVYVGKMDIDQAGNFPGSLGVRGIPDVRIFKDGKEVDRFVGFPGRDDVLQRVAKFSKGIQPSPGASAPAAAQPQSEVKPFTKDWLPPGMSRPGDSKPSAKP